MPQLAPLNWMLLFFMFWGSVFFVSVFIWWWTNKSYTFFLVNKNNLNKVAKWLW